MCPANNGANHWNAPPSLKSSELQLWSESQSPNHPGNCAPASTSGAGASIESRTSLRAMRWQKSASPANSARKQEQRKAFIFIFLNLKQVPHSRVIVCQYFATGLSLGGWCLAPECSNREVMLLLKLVRLRKHGRFESDFYGCLCC